jgi:ribonuclease-3
LFSKTGIRPGNISLYEQAFVHRSTLRRHQKGYEINNERLEYLGDAIIGAVVAQELYQLFPDKDEGFLTKTRAKIVNRANMNKIAGKMELQKYIQFNPPSDISQTHVLGDALEAIIGAIFIDKGYSKARKFIRKKIMAEYLDLPHIVKNDSNYKSMLIEWGQKNRHSVHFITEEYPISNLNGPLFVSQALIDSETAGQGEGNTKKEAQQKAAGEAMGKVDAIAPTTLS